MLTDFKIHRLVETPSGVECVIRIYEGEVTAEIEEVRGKIEPEPVTRYRRTKMVKEISMSLPAGTTEQEILARCKGKLTERVSAERKKQRTIEPIPQQK